MRRRFLPLLLVGTALAQTPNALPTQNAASQQSPCPAVTAVDKGEVLLSIKRIYVDSFGDDLISKQLQSMVITSLTESKRFVVTENRERADAILKGTALEKTSQEVHSYGSATAVGGAVGGHSGSINGTVSNGNGVISGSSSGGFVAHHAAIDDSSTNTETIDDARVAVRLVDKDGDVVWTTTQESKGAKYKGSSADAADKVTKQLLRDIEKLEKSKIATDQKQSAGMK